MRIYGINAICEQNLCSQNLRHNTNNQQVYFGKIDEEAKPAFNKIAQRSFDTKFYVREIDKSDVILGYLNSNGEPECKFIEPENEKIKGFYAWFASSDAKDCMKNLNDNNLKTLTQHLDEAFNQIWKKLSGGGEELSIEERNRLIDEDRYYNSDS